MATPIPENRIELSLMAVARATGGEITTGREPVIRGVTTDSRGDVSGKLFVALEGEHFDGHAFVADAAQRGAAAVLISKALPVPAETGVVRVGNTLEALGALAALHRKQWGGTVVAIGGSAGKTTTKSAIAAAAEAVAPGEVRAVAGNLNNLVGVPMVLLSCTKAHRIAVLELGTNQPGEVAELAKMTRPDIAVLTLVAVEHTEGLGDLDGVETEEGRLFSTLGPSGTAIGNLDDARVARQLERSRAGKKLGYGSSAQADYRVLERAGSDLALCRPGKSALIRVRTTLLGLPGALATAAALATADQLAGGEVDIALFQRALDALGSGEPGRLTPCELADGSLLIDDSYNANPASVRSAVKTAAEIADARGARLLLVLGEMRELGRLSEGEHHELGVWLGTTVATHLVAVGGDAREVARAARGAGLESEYVSDAAAALPIVLQHMRPGDVVLVKGSRGVRTERVVEGIVSAKGRAA